MHPKEFRARAKKREKERETNREKLPVEVAKIKLQGNMREGDQAKNQQLTTNNNNHCRRRLPVNSVISSYTK